MRNTIESPRTPVLAAMLVPALFVAAGAALGQGASEGAARHSSTPKLSMPIACEPGVTCFVQSHVDRDGGPGSTDFRCGTATYDKHKGVDFRLLSVAAANAGVPVLAAADGIVTRLRNDMAEGSAGAGSLRSGDASIAGRECGNGVVLDHGGGWETQYCHMRRGSVAVKPGQPVKRGETIGLVGISGLAEFAHVHISVRRDGAIVDPYDGGSGDKACATGAASPADTAGGLWDDAARAAFPYRNGEIIGAGFAGETLTTERLEQDHVVEPPGPASPMLLVYARIANMREGDRLRLTLAGPGGLSVAQTTSPVERAKAVYVGFAGKRRRVARWPAGRYSARVELLRKGEAIADARPKDLVLP